MVLGVGIGAINDEKIIVFGGYTKSGGKGERKKLRFLCDLTFMRFGVINLNLHDGLVQFKLTILSIFNFS
jgi:hypothetical protein